MIVDSFVSKNPSLEVIDVNQRRQLRAPEGFDWNEQDRVAEAVVSVHASWNESLWFAMVKHIDDNRDSLITRSPNGPMLRYWKVGEICRLLADRQLETVIEDIARELRSRTVNVGKSNDPYTFEWWGDERTIRDWVAKRRGKSYRELQLEVISICENQLAGDRKIEPELRKKGLAMLASRRLEVETAKSLFKKINLSPEEFPPITRNDVK